MLQKLRVLQSESRPAGADYEPEGIRTVHIQQASDLARDSYRYGNIPGHTPPHCNLPAVADHDGYCYDKRGQQVSTITYQRLKNDYDYDLE